MTKENGLINIMNLINYLLDKILKNYKVKQTNVVIYNKKNI